MRHRVRPYGQSITGHRGFSLLMALMLIGMLYEFTSQPATWQWLAEAEDEVPVAAQSPVADAAPVAKTGANKAAPTEKAAAAPAKPESTEKVVPGPNDLDAEEIASFRKKLPLLKDEADLMPREMYSYYQLLGWARTEPIKKLEQRADANTTFTQIWQDRDKYRGKLVRLRMHVRRVLKHDAPGNPLGIKQLYEAWGWTEDSKSFPYCVVFPELPKGLKLGADVRGEIVFVGYFMKIMRYKAFDSERGTPLLIGRARLAGPLPPKKLDGFNKIDPLTGVIVGILFTSLLGAVVTLGRRKSRRSTLPEKLDGDLPLVGVGSGSAGGFGNESPEIMPGGVSGA